jgi:hypothetical protein
VVIALTQGNSALISSGLNAGDQVVTEGQDKLQAGSTVTAKAPRVAQNGAALSPNGAGGLPAVPGTPGATPKAGGKP